MHSIIYQYEQLFFFATVNLHTLRKSCETTLICCPRVNKLEIDTPVTLAISI